MKLSNAGADMAEIRDDLSRLLAAVCDGQRSEVETLMSNPRRGGRGLRSWLAIMAVDQRPLPDTLPWELVEVYLQDDDAEPFYDCERCGLPVPVRTARSWGHEATVERVYFPTCPCCGGRTGRYAYWSRRAASGAS